ncbi:alpha/beta fold hydrolase [Rubrivivax sp. RP6-9]|uniref:alpha/beta fold hydrolase n=1 Tax=Rubrivivax sp. RP6-9 TaxID=3415750 RepID=UPI003CC5A45F
MTDVLLKSLGALLILVALAMALLRAPDRPVESLVARWAPPPSDFIDVKGQLVHLRDEGPRNDLVPVVLIHGTSASLHTWEGWVAALKTQRRVITLDLPGFGLTGPYTGQYDPDDYSGDGYARFVLDVLDRLQVQRFVIGGNSLGGEVAWRTAYAARDRVERLILVDSAGLPFDRKAAPLAWWIARTPGLGWLSESMLPRSLVQQGLESVYGHPERITPALVDRYLEISLRDGNRRALGQRLRQMDFGTDAARLDTLKLPTLILWGGQDRLFTPDLGREFQRRIAGSQLQLFDDLGHVPHEEDAARTVQPVKAFLGL